MPSRLAPRLLLLSALLLMVLVFLPLTLHEVLAGGLVVFVLGMGFFMTPALMDLRRIRKPM